MVYKNWESLERDVVSKVREATRDCTKWTLNRLEENLARFYESPEPDVYERTHHLEHSGKEASFSNIANGAMGTVIIDQRPFYTTGTYDTMMVFENAETGYAPSNMLGNPLFWEDTMRDLETNFIPTSFGRFFIKK